MNVEEGMETVLHPLDESMRRAQIANQIAARQICLYFCSSGGAGLRSIW
jgi:hypothetical protein